MALDPELFKNMKVSEVPMAYRMSDEEKQEIRDERRRMEEKQDAEKLRLEAKQDVLNERQLQFQQAQLAYNLVVNPEFNGLCKAESHPTKEDIEMCREARRAAVGVLQGYMKP